MLKFLIYLFVFYFIFRFLFKGLFNVKVYQYNQYNQPQANQQKEQDGTITINKKVYDKGKQNGQIGEYVDYEEVK